MGKSPDGKDEFEANISADDNHKHYGKGQKETTLELKPGKHTLELVLGAQHRIPRNPPVVSDVIAITVK